MNLNRGRNYVAIPGPSVVPDRVLQAMHRASPNIYSGEIVGLVEGILEDLKRVAGTAFHSTIYISNGHGVWECSLSNTLSPGDRILVLVTGLFARGWGGFAERLGADVEYVDFGMRSGIDTEAVHDRLKRDTSHSIKAILAVQVDTATSVRNDIASLARTIRTSGHPALLMVDCIASLACEEFRMDDWGVDVMIAGSQKGLMTPPGLGFVFFNERARTRCRDAALRTPYWDWNRRIDPEEFYFYFCGTAPTHHLYGLREALDMLLLEEGMNAAWSRHRVLAHAVWAALERWGSEGNIEPNIPDPRFRSHAVTTVRADPPIGRELRRWTEENAGLTLGIGLGMATPDDPESTACFRIGHMGHLNPHMLLGALASIESGLAAVDCRRGSGAVDAAAGVCAAGSRDPTSGD